MNTQVMKVTKNSIMSIIVVDILFIRVFLIRSMDWKYIYHKIYWPSFAYIRGSHSNFCSVDWQPDSTRKIFWLYTCRVKRSSAPICPLRCHFARVRTCYVIVIFTFFETRILSKRDVGLGKIGRSHPNILVLAAGGYGHVPLPLIKGEIAYSPIPFTSSLSSLTLLQAKQLQQAHTGLPSKDSFDIWSNIQFQFGQDIGFFGSTGVMQQSRNQMLAIIKGEAEQQNLTYKQGSGSRRIHAVCLHLQSS